MRFVFFFQTSNLHLEKKITIKKNCIILNIKKTRRKIEKKVKKKKKKQKNRKKNENR